MSELEIKHLAGKTYYIPSPTNVGIYVENDKAVIIDSGNDDEAGRQILRLLQNKGWTLSMIVNTHSNADHIGGNQFLQKRTQCRIAATQAEAAFIKTPLLETAILYGGYPFQGLNNKFLQAKASTVTDIIPSSGPIADTPLKAIPLPGHYWEMIGVETPDRITFLGDSLFPENIIAKYHLVYLFDIGAHLETLNLLQTFEADLFIPSHAKPMTELGETIMINRGKIEEITTFLREICAGSPNTEEILQQVCKKYAINLNDNGYVLGISTIRSFLSYMENQNLVGHALDNGILKWFSK